jgi:hypothetical protein
MTYYEKNREKRLEYQKNYIERNKQNYNLYQATYYHVRKEQPDFEEKRKGYRIRWYNKEKEKKLEKKSIKESIKRTKQLKKKMLKELLKKICLYSEPEPVVEVEPRLESTPFAGIKLNTKGHFILDW